MKALLSLICLVTAFIPFKAFSQESPIEVEQKLLRKLYYHEGRLLDSNKQFKQVLSSNQASLKQYKLGAGLKITGNVFESVGLIALVTGSIIGVVEGTCEVAHSFGTFGYAITGGYGNPPVNDCPDTNFETIIITGAVVLGVGIILDLTGTDQKRKAIKKYNHDLNKGNTSCLKLGLNQNGVGLVYRF